MNLRQSIKEWTKTIAVTAVIIVLLQVTGLLSSVTFAMQSALLKTGLMDASPDAPHTEETFDYNFALKDMTGNIVDFNQYKGKVLFINLWATWCGPCRAEMASIQQLYEKTNHDSVQFVMLSVDREKDKQKVADYIKSKAFSFPVFMRSGSTTSQLTVPGIPTTFVISKDGKVAMKEVGTTNYDTNRFRKFLTQLVNK